MGKERHQLNMLAPWYPRERVDIRFLGIHGVIADFWGKKDMETDLMDLGLQKLGEAHVSHATTRMQPEHHETHD